MIYFNDSQDFIEIGDFELDMVEAAIIAVAEEFELNEYEVSVSFVSPEAIRKLNSDYRGVDRVTDVLSFPLEYEFCDLNMLGDIVINTRKVYEQAEEYGHSRARELSYLTVHSMLHLLGYDHEDEEDKLMMRIAEKKVMKRLGGEKFEEQ